MPRLSTGRTITLTALALMSCMSPLTPVHAAETPTIEQAAQELAQGPESAVASDTNRLIVKLADPAADKSAITQDAQALTDTIDQATLLKDQLAGDASTIVLKTDAVLDPQEQATTIAQLEADPRIESVEPSRLVKALSSTPTAEPFYPRLWAFGTNHLNAPAFWNAGYTGKGVTVGIVDTGYATHPDLKNPVASYDFVSDTSISLDGNGRDADARDMGNRNANANWHGLFIQGQIAAQPNGSGVVGLAYDADLVMARALGYQGLGFEDDMADSIVWLAGGSVAGVPKNPRPVSVINASFAWPSATCSPIMHQAITFASNKNVPVVVAAGNSGVNANGITPANCYRAVVVGSSTSWGTMTTYSNWGSMLDVVAPGGTTGSDIFSTTNTGFSSIGTPTYGTKNGTSMAAPFVTGTIAGMQQAYPGITLEQIRQTLVNTGKNVGGYRQIQPVHAANAAKALRPAAPRFTLKAGSGIEAAYWRYGGTATFGAATSNEFPLLGGYAAAQNFANHRTIYWSERTGAHPVVWTGGIGVKFRQAGYENAYGVPLFTETGISGGAMQKFAKPNGATTALYWAASHQRTHAVWEAGGIGGKFTRDGGTARYGFPVEDETVLAHGARQIFETSNSSTGFYWSPNTGVNLMNQRGGIYATWIARGGAARVGFPATNEVAAGAGGVTQLFRTANGTQTLYTWSPTAGTHTVHATGAIYHHWRSTGFTTTYGYPITDEAHVGNGVYQVKFSSGKTINWSATRGIWVS